MELSMVTPVSQLAVSSFSLVVILILFGLLIVVISHLFWRIIANVVRKIFITPLGSEFENKVRYGDTKYKNQQLIISIAGFFVLSLVFIVIYIWLPDVWVGYQVILIMAIILIPGIIHGILLSRRRDKNKHSGN
jgi:intracellular septation protein A